MKNYISLAHRTSAPVEPVIDRLASNPNSLGQLFFILHGLASYAAALDKWKAWAYYGKGSPPNPPNNKELSPEYPIMALESALSTIDSPHFLEVLHAVVGIGSEAGELAEAMMPVLFGGAPIDLTNAHEEGGDILWYLAKFFKFTNTDFDTVMAANIAKLRARYPQKFTEEAAKNRDLEAERNALNSGVDGSIMPNGEFVPDSVDIKTMRKELCAWLDKQMIHSENIGIVRNSCMLPFDSEWNGIVREETATREKH